MGDRTWNDGAAIPFNKLKHSLGSTSAMLIPDKNDWFVDNVVVLPA